MKPDEIIIAWDGAGGSLKRRAINSNYKVGRKPIRLNRDIRVLTKDEELQNKVWQQYRLMEMLNFMPVIQLTVDAVEADDVISFVSQTPYYKGWEKVIISSDKDFFQLCDDETVLYRPIQKKFMNKPRLLEEFKIHPTNFALARAMAGDPSDNLPGVKGVGLGTIAKRLTFFADSKSVTIPALIEFCENSNTGLRAFASICESKEVIEENYKIMQLYSPSMSLDDKSRVKYAIDNFDPEFNKTEVIKRMAEDGFGNWDTSDLFTTFKRMINNA